MKSTPPRLLLLSATILIALVEPAHANWDPGFAYTGDRGPQFWGELDALNLACDGSHQTPINIRRSRAEFDFSLKRLHPSTHPEPINLRISAFALQMDYANGSSVEFGGKTWDLLQFHFHTLSEHAIDGQLGAMELHAVHVERGGSNLLVMGQLFKIGPTPNRFLQSLVDAGLPEKSHDQISSDKRIDLQDAFTNTASYYTYSGSLTTPPCSEIVTWVVLKQPANMTRKQLRAFQGVMGNNFRPLQHLNDRQVRQTFR